MLILALLLVLLYCRYYKEELSEDVKAALAAALGAWLPRCSGMPEPALARMTGGRGARFPEREGEGWGACWSMRRRLACWRASAGPASPPPSHHSRDPLPRLPPAESLKEKEALRRAHLRALAAALRQNQEARGQVRRSLGGRSGVGAQQGMGSRGRLMGPAAGSQRLAAHPFRLLAC